MKTQKKRAIWPYIVTAAAVVVAVVLVAVLVVPHMFHGSSIRNSAVSEYAAEETTLKSPSSYDELYQVLKKHAPKTAPGYGNSALDFFDTGADGAVAEESAEDIPMAVNTPTAAASDAATGTSPAYSDTNIRTAGVYEGDIVKTDGRYIYTLYPVTGEFSIADTNNGMKSVYSGQLLDTCDSCREFYIRGDRMYFTGFREVYSYEESAGGSWQGQSFLLTYDITDRSAPVLTDTYTQCGHYDSARIADNTFYLLTNYYTYDLDKEQYIPTFNNEKIACEDIYYGKHFDSANYYCIGAVDLDHPGTCLDAKAVLAENGEYYVSARTVYVLSNNWITENNHSFSRTDIVSIGYDAGNLTGLAIGSVDGYLNDSFSIDEYNGFLRLVTTINDQTTPPEPSFLERWFDIYPRYDYTDYSSTENNSLWVLNGDLSVVSSIDNIQEDELVQSARFMGDIVYFVTFRNTDPLFAADLSDPYHPQMLSGLKITGFSNYLHPWSENLLVGIGYNGTESGMLNGAKISMFDISNPKDIREIDRYVIEDTEEANMLSSDYSYKAVMVDPEKNLIGFAVQDYKYKPEEQFEGSAGTYYVFSYEEGKGFTELMKTELYEDNYWYAYIDDPYIIEDEAGTEPETYYEEDTPYMNDTASSDSIFDSFAKENDTGSDVDALAKKDDSSITKDIFEQIPEADRYLYKTIQYVRGLYIGDQFYISYPGIAIFQYDLQSRTLKDTLPLYNPDAK